MASRCATRPDLRRGENGFTIIELMVACVILVVGMAVAFVGFVGPQKLSQTAVRNTQAAAIAEAQLESVIGRPYADIAVTSLPTHQADSYASDPNYVVNTNNPSNPLYYVDDPTFYTGSCSVSNGTFPALVNFNNAALGQLVEAPSCGETLAPASTNGVAFSQSTPTGAPAGTIYTFITYREEACSSSASSISGEEQTWITTITSGIISWASGLLNALFDISDNTSTPAAQFCSQSNNNEKRVTVAVLLSQPGSLAGLEKPVWASTLIPNPAAGAPEPSSSSCSVSWFCW